MNVGRSIELPLELTAEPTPEPSSMVTEEAWDVLANDDVETTADPFPPSERGLDRERLLFEAGRLYGRDTARERAALLDGSHPLHRLKHPAS